MAGRGRGARAASLQCAGGRGARGGGAAILGAGRRAAAVVAVAAAAGEVLRSPPGCAVPVPPPGGFLRLGSLCGRARAVAELLRVTAPWALVGGWGLQAQGRGGGCRVRCPPAALGRDARVPPGPGGGGRSGAAGRAFPQLPLRGCRATPSFVRTSLVAEGIINSC